MLKIDVQGYEATVLQGALQTIKRDRPFIFYEQQFQNKEEGRRDGALLWQVLGTNATYRCKCGNDCLCSPRHPPRSRRRQ